jgi:hypothetical protein
MNAFIISVGLFQQMLVGKSHEIPDVFGLNPQIKPIYIYCCLSSIHIHSSYAKVMLCPLNILSSY